MSLQSRLRQAAICSHEDCDGRFCTLDEHPEMEAIKRIAELEAENKALREALHEIYGRACQVMGDDDEGFRGFTRWSMLLYGFASDARDIALNAHKAALLKEGGDE